MEDSRTLLHNADQDHHCHDHPHFTPSCESCQRARAAFLPYHNISTHPEPSSRSFQTMLGPAFPPSIQVGLTEAIAFGVAEGVTEEIIGILEN